MIRDDLKKWAKEHEKANGDNYDIYEDGLRIYTTINPRMQLYAEEAVARNIPNLQKALSAQKSVRTDAVWKGHDNVLDARNESDRTLEKLKENGLTEEEIRKSFTTKSTDEGLCLEFEAGKGYGDDAA